MDTKHRARASGTLFVHLLAVICILYGCKDVGSVGPAPQTPEIVPLSLGNQWILADTSYDMLGNLQEVSWQYYTITRDTVLFGQRLFSYWGFCANTDSGLVTYEGFTRSPWTGDTVALYRLFYKYPASPGQAYAVGGTITEDTIIATKTIVGSTDTLIRVPAGAFHCINYRFYFGDQPSADHFVSPGIGLVKLVTYWQTNIPADPIRVHVAGQLKTYTLK